MTMINHRAEGTVCAMDDGGEYHLNNNNEEEEGQQQQHINNTRAKHQHWLFRRYNKKLVLAVVDVAVVLMLLVALMALVANKSFANASRSSHQQQCPSDVDRWVYYNGAYFSYSLYLQQWPNPDPTILILHGGGYYVTDNEDNNPNNFSYGQGCGAGGWTVTYGYADGSSFTYEYSVPSDDDDVLRQQGGTFSIGGVEYDLKNNGSVFLIAFEQNENKVTQLSGLDLSSLVIDQETMSVASVTEFCYANQDILDFFDSTRANNNNNAGDDA